MRPRWPAARLAPGGRASSGVVWPESVDRGAGPRPDGSPPPWAPRVPTRPSASSTELAARKSIEDRAHRGRGSGRLGSHRRWLRCFRDGRHRRNGFRPGHPQVAPHGLDLHPDQTLTHHDETVTTSFVSHTRVALAVEVTAQGPVVDPEGRSGESEAHVATHAAKPMTGGRIERPVERDVTAHRVEVRLAQERAGESEIPAHAVALALPDERGRADVAAHGPEVKSALEILEHRVSGNVLEREATMKRAHLEVADHAARIEHGLARHRDVQVHRDLPPAKEVAPILLGVLRSHDDRVAVLHHVDLEALQQLLRPLRAGAANVPARADGHDPGLACPDARVAGKVRNTKRRDPHHRKGALDLILVPLALLVPVAQTNADVEHVGRAVELVAKCSGEPPSLGSRLADSQGVAPPPLVAFARSFVHRALA